MASGSVWIRPRPTKAGGVRHRVEYRLGGREAPTLFGGSFGTKREASIRKVWILNEIAAGRAPNLNLLTETQEPRAPTLADAAERWRVSRVDVTESTRTLHRVALARALPMLGSKRVDEIAVEDVVGLVTALSGNGSKRETIRKTVKYLAAVLDEAGVERTRRVVDASGFHTKSRKSLYRRVLSTSKLCTGCSHPCTGCRFCGSTGPAREWRAST
jgi:hypothetical protein